MSNLVNSRIVQGEIKVSHRPQTVREVNDWLRRMNVASKLRVRTIQNNLGRYISIQEFQRDRKWRAIAKCENIDSIIFLLVEFVPVDWPM